ncbi:hypothetical protein AMJ83_01975 [candidate division WOR_3 bacterium SM23_42]|uniref:Squalene cyclase C-terminal domain-containing protein n=1 Tax=candidate division WOR_3 bacterium SM23_42 TaxID=1703779 RepID=A0A0S8FV02_UNCW3|nr:MAG: hypothetical protein AMJ83_01975 [candidate division WOR_3 bacterium SM23_42]
MSKSIIQQLLSSAEPSIRYKTRILLLNESKSSAQSKKLRQEIKHSTLVRVLLKNRNAKGQLEPIKHVYRKWQGAHWVVACLADLGYPEGDKDLVPIIDQVLNLWLSPVFVNEVIRDFAQPAYKDEAVPIIQGRARRCASQQGNALFSSLALGFSNERTGQLAALLMKWQWPDGGWNCDRRPSAHHSSFWESLLPLRGLALYAKREDSRDVYKTVKRAAELFLKKKLFKRESNGRVMNEEFLQLHYPHYWRYDILFGLKVMAEAGFIGDERCQDALDILEEKRLPNGGWPAEARFYQNTDEKKSNYDLVDWGGVNKRKCNEWVTVDAFHVLKEAGRLRI